MSHFEKAKLIDVMKHFALFLLILILSGLVALSHVPREVIVMKEGVMALSHVSRGSTAPSDLGITRVTELKSVDSPEQNRRTGRHFYENLSAVLCFTHTGKEAGYQ